MLDSCAKAQVIGRARVSYLTPKSDLGHVTQSGQGHVKEWHDVKQGVACFVYWSCWPHVKCVMELLVACEMCHVKEWPMPCQRVACVMSKSGLCHVKEWPVSCQRVACIM